MKNLRLLLVLASLAFIVAAAAVHATARPSGAIIHEMIGASCSVNGAPEPSGQAGNSNGN